MALSGISSASSHAAAQQIIESLAPHKHDGHRPQSLADGDAAGSSAASPPSASGKIGSRIDITA
jgi:hypothetical protein